MVQYNPQDYFEQGNKLFEQGDYEGAIHSYNKALEIDPKYVPAWTNKGAALGSLGRHEEAIDCSDKALEIDPKDALAWTSKGAALGSLGRYEEAIVCFSKSLEFDPKDARAWGNKGVALSSLNKYREAEQAARVAVNLDPQNTLFLNNWGDILLKLKCYYEAEDTYIKSTEIELTWQGHMGLAKVYIELGDNLEEKELYQYALDNLDKIDALLSKLEREEDKRDYYFQRGYANAKLGRWKEAKEDYLKCKGDARAKRNLKKLRSVAKGEKGPQRAQVYGGWALFGISFAMLIAVWVLFGFNIVDTDLLKVLIPTLLFFMAVGVCFPYIKSLKGPAGIGFEKEITIRPQSAPLEIQQERLAP